MAQLRGLHRFGELPIEVVRIAMAVDVQKQSLFYGIRGWGERASSWQIDIGEFAGLTDEQEVWGDLADLITTTYDGIPISLVLIDSGFRANKPDQGSDNVVYEFCRRFSRIARPTKGYDVLQAPVMKGKAKLTIPGRHGTATLELIRLDTDFWKSRLHDRLSWPSGQPGGFTLAADATDLYCKSLVSEVRKVLPSGKPAVDSDRAL